MKKKLTTIIALILTIAAAVFFGDTTKTARIYDNNINTVSYTDLGVLTEGQELSQQFTCMQDSIDGIMMKTGVAGDHDDAVVTLTITDADTGQVLYNTEEKGSQFRPRKIHYFRTSHFEKMKGRSLIVTVSESGSASGNGITFYYTGQDQAESFASLDGETLPGVLPMGTAVDGFDIETFLVFLFSVWFIWGFMWFLYKLFQ